MKKIQNTFKGLIASLLVMAMFVTANAATTCYSSTKTFTSGTLVKCTYRGKASFTNKIYDSGTAAMQMVSISLGNPSITTSAIDNKYTYVNLTGNISWPSNYNNKVTATVYGPE